MVVYEGAAKDRAARRVEATSMRKGRGRGQGIGRGRGGPDRGSGADSLANVEQDMYQPLVRRLASVRFWAGSAISERHD